MRTLIAGLGNIFHGDDGVGVAVAQTLLAQPLPDGVTVRDFGVRGVHLAYELLDGYDLVVIVDAVRRGGAPGTIHIVEHPVHTEADPGGPTPGVLVDAHDLAPDEVLALVPALGGTLGRVVVVGCEIGRLAACSELSPELAACVPHAAAAALDVVRVAHRATVMRTGGR